MGWLRVGLLGWMDEMVGSQVLRPDLDEARACRSLP